MRVLVFSQYFWPESFRVNAFATALRDAGADVTVLTGKPNYPDGKIPKGYRAVGTMRERYDDIEVLRVPIVPRGPATAVRLVANYTSFVISAAVFGPRLLRGRAFDVILVYAPSPIVQVIPAILLKRITGARLVTWVQDLWPESLSSTGFVRSEVALALIDHLVRWIYRKNDLLLGQSKAFVTAMGPKAPLTPIEYFPNPGEIERPSTDAAALDLPPGFNVVFAGNLGTVQALDTVLDAAELLRDTPAVRIVIVGSGSRSSWLAEQVKSRGLMNVMLPGRFPPSAMPAIYEQASALLVSLSRSEILAQTLPAKLQTYLAAGRPVLASLDGEGAALVRDACAGLASPAEDAPALAANIRALSSASEGARTAMGTAARDYYARHFQPDLLACQLLAIFHRLTTTPRLHQ